MGAVVHVGPILQFWIDVFNKAAYFRPHPSLHVECDHLKIIYEESFKERDVEIEVSLEVIARHAWPELLVVSYQNELLNVLRDAAHELWLKDFRCFLDDHDLAAYLPDQLPHLRTASGGHSYDINSLQDLLVPKILIKIDGFVQPLQPLLNLLNILDHIRYLLEHVEIQNLHIGFAQLLSHFTLPHVGHDV